MEQTVPQSGPGHLQEHAAKTMLWSERSDLRVSSMHFGCGQARFADERSETPSQFSSAQSGWRDGGGLEKMSMVTPASEHTAAYR